MVAYLGIKNTNTIATKEDSIDNEVYGGDMHTTTMMPRSKKAGYPNGNPTQHSTEGFPLHVAKCKHELDQTLIHFLIHHSHYLLSSLITFVFSFSHTLKTHTASTIHNSSISCRPRLTAAGTPPSSFHRASSSAVHDSLRLKLRCLSVLRITAFV
ncbi:hypothetical protein S83_031372 [Arachis hypogaea]